MIFNLSELADFLGGECFGDPNKQVKGIAPLDDSDTDYVSVLLNPKEAQRAQQSRAGILILSKKIDGISNQVLVKSPKQSMDQLLRTFYPDTPIENKIAASAIIDESATVSDQVNIGEYVVIGKHVQIADGVQIDSFVKIADRVRIGKGTKVGASVVIGENAQIGSNVVIAANSTLGMQGFGFYQEGPVFKRLKHIAGLIIGNRVEIGSNVCIDRGCLTDTIIEDDVKIDNLCQIAHNVTIKKNTLLAGATILAGSVTVGESVIMGGDVVVADKVSISDGLIIEGASRITKSLDYPPGTILSGFPAIPAKEHWKKQAITNRLIKKYQQSKKES